MTLKLPEALECTLEAIKVGLTKSRSGPNFPTPMQLGTDLGIEME